MITDHRQPTTNRGFTLAELIVSVALFVLVMTMSMTSIVGIFDANRKSRTLRSVSSNLNLTVESMSKEIRFGTNYHCGFDTDTATSVANCDIASGGNVRINFLSSSGVQISYRKWNNTIEKQVGIGGPYIAITAPEVIIDSLIFYVIGAGTTDTLQPKVIMKIKSHAGTGKSQTDFTLQTLVSQRTLDI